MGICSNICVRKSILVTPGRLQFEETRELELKLANMKKLESVPKLSINESFLYKKRRSVSGGSLNKTDETKEVAV